MCCVASPDEVFSIATRVTLLRDGRRVGTFTVDELDEARWWLASAA